jgi:hypothetical protein
MSRSFMLGVLSCVVASAFALGALPARAQDADAVRVKVPFAFKVGHELLPAGDYEVRFDELEAPGVLKVRSEDGHHGAFVLVDKTDPPNGSDKPRLLFDKEDGTYVLTEVVGTEAGQAVQVLGTHPVQGGEPAEAAPAAAQ